MFPCSNTVKVSLGAGSSHGAILFCFGISISIMSSLMSYRREVDKLSGLLKQTEDLVQDLQEELDMKDSLTVKEILANAHKSQDTHEDTIGKEEEVDAFSSEQKFGQLAEGQQEDCDERAQEESMRKIEAELEAELATLELNMTSSLEKPDVTMLPKVVLSKDLREIDSICYLNAGNSKWVHAMEWSGQKDFVAASTTPFLVDCAEAGQMKNHGPLTFIKNAAQLCGIPIKAVQNPKSSLNAKILLKASRDKAYLAVKRFNDNAVTSINYDLKELETFADERFQSTACCVFRVGVRSTRVVES
ncbi:hypothetical protein POM88_041363 [Heracleum sosnowskyi]|uniref:Uncharacterized protein n=1 Tax=Heracleum sosnowskyi TaxID=360622 RepID=A0AAD8HGM7_9APIA|nr:hypothetical protein POM88_041363 [Heracleum sosnowskyi]